MKLRRLKELDLRQRPLLRQRESDLRKRLLQQRLRQRHLDLSKKPLLK